MASSLCAHWLFSKVQTPESDCTEQGTGCLPVPPTHPIPGERSSGFVLRIMSR